MEFPSDLKKFILDKRDLLTKQQERLAVFVLENMGDIPFLPVPELARKSGVSEATVVRFAQRLGFEGFSELKSAFVAHLQARDPQVEPPKEGDTLFETVLNQDVANLQKCHLENERSQLLEVAGRLSKAEMNFCFGLGSSSIMAEFLAYQLNQIGLRATALSCRYSSPLEQLVSMKEGDHLCCLSFPPYSRPTIDLITGARKRNIMTTAFCDRISAPITQFADITLLAPSEGMMFTNSMTALMMLINALVTETGKLDGSKTLQAVDHINKALSEDPGVISSA